MTTKWRKIYQHYPFQGPPIFTQVGIFGMKIYHLATLMPFSFKTDCLVFFSISVILVEVTQAGRLFKGSKTDLKKFLQKRGFKLFKDVGFDQIYVKKDAAKNVKNLKGGKK
jgi:hypothetical protein